MAVWADDDDNNNETRCCGHLRVPIGGSVSKQATVPCPLLAFLLFLTMGWQCGAGRVYHGVSCLPTMGYRRRAVWAWGAITLAV